MMMTNNNNYKNDSSMAVSHTNIDEINNLKK